MPNSKCCLCLQRIPSNKRCREVRQKLFYKDFQRFVREQKPETEFTLTSHVCSTCYIKICNYCSRHPIFVPESQPLQEFGSQIEQDIVEESEPMSIPSSSSSPSHFDSESLGQDLQVLELADSLYEDPPSPQPGPSRLCRMIPQEDYSDSEEISPSLYEDEGVHSPIVSNSQCVPEISQESFPSSTQSSSSTVFLQHIKTCIASEKYCFICKDKQGRLRVPATAIKQAWDILNILIPNNNRTCGHHLEDGRFSAEALTQIQSTRTGVNMSTEDLGDFILHLTNSNRLKIDFSTGHLSDEKYFLYTGLKKSEFEELFSYIEHGLKDSSNRHPKNALAMFLCLMRLSIPQKLIADFFGTEQTVVSATIDRVSSLLEQHFLPYYLGFGPQHITPEQCIQEHGSAYFNKIFDQRNDTMKISADGSYLYIEKPGNHGEQRKTYSGQKHRNLIKPMMFVLPDGYILESAGCFYANGGNNDANIFKYIIRQDEFKNFFPRGTVFIVDRGFRDVIELLRAMGFEVFMPELMDRKDKQFSTTAANTSRRVSAVRWTVEAVNGRQKNSWKFFETVIPGGYAGHVTRFFRICCAISNKFFRPLHQDQERHEKIAEAITARLDMPNLLQSRVQESGWERMTVKWTKGNELDLPEFPRLTMEDLQTLTLGVYQLAQAERYTKDHLDDEDHYPIYLHLECDTIVRAKLKSRFAGSKTHYIWVEFRQQNGLGGILGYYCTCKTGARNLGCCSHVASVIRYLSYDRFQPPRQTRKRRKIDLIDAGEELARLVEEDPISQDQFAFGNQDSEELPDI